MYYIGVDAGGTKTRAAIINNEGHVSFECISGHGNVTVNLSEAKQNIHNAILHCLENQHGISCNAIVAGIAGIETGSIKSELYDYLRNEFELPQLILSDTELAYYANFGINEGVLAIAGTGSVFLGKAGDNFRSIGGWGHLLGDEGSAYSIGINALKKVTAEIDDNRTLSPFSKAITQEYLTTDSKSIKKFVYSSSKSSIANISQGVYDLAKNNDAYAIYLIKNAAVTLSQKTILLMKQLNLTNSIKIKCSGGLFEQNDLIQNLFNENMTNNYPGIITDFKKTKAVIGVPYAWNDKRK